MDYLAPATGDLRAVADVVRFGGSVAAVDIEVYDVGAAEDDRHVATARGVYKTGGQGEETPWTDGVDVDARGTLDD
jgi:acyl-coenzyme A thioesterase PaaI-like protein